MCIVQTVKKFAQLLNIFVFNFTYNVLSLKKFRFYYSSPKRVPALIIVLKIPRDPQFVIKLTSLTVVHTYTERSGLYLHIYIYIRT